MSKRTIGGALDSGALARLRFHSLTRDEQANEVRERAATGESDCAIAQLTGLAVEQIQRILAQNVRR